MFDIYVERVIAKDIDVVFELLADHEGYTQLKGVNRVKLLEVGETEKNGLGALRHVDLGAVQFDERITCFQRPYRMDYKIERSSPLPFKHELGSITLNAIEGGTQVIWISKGTVAVPLFGKLFLDKVFERKGNQGFGSLLKQIANL